MVSSSCAFVMFHGSRVPVATETKGIMTAMRSCTSATFPFHSGFIMSRQDAGASGTMSALYISGTDPQTKGVP